MARLRALRQGLRATSAFFQTLTVQAGLCAFGRRDQESL